MPIVILTLGSRGDVEPFAALGKRLRAAGHAVRLAAGRDAAPMAALHGLPFAPLSIDFQSLLNDLTGQGPFDTLRGVWRAMQAVRPLMRQVLDDSWAAASDADLLIYHPKILAGPHIAEKLDVPALVALPIPALTPTVAFPTPLLRWPNLSGTTNRLSHRVVGMADVVYRGVIDTWREQTLGLPPSHSTGTSLFKVRGRPVPRLYGFSEALVPWPRDWSDQDHITGSWFSEPDPAWSPPEALVQFLADNPPPVYIGFGSMVTGDPAARTAMVAEALAIAGLRAVLVTGWGGLSHENLGQHVHATGDVPHEWLFPRVRALVHHGGAGTTHRGLRHGRPTLICPLFGDQPFWGGRVAALGAGPTPLPLKQLNAHKLAGKLKDLVETRDYATGAASIARQMEKDDPDEAVRVVEAYLARSRSLPS